MLGAVLCFSLVSCNDKSSPPKFSKAEFSPGGELSAKRLSERGFVTPGKAIANRDKLNFWTGFSLFRDPWVIAPSSTTDRDGLGPLFNTRSCISCHIGGARGHQAEVGLSKPSALVIRFGPNSLNSNTNNAHDMQQQAIFDPVYGDQLQSRAINISHSLLKESVKAEAKLYLEYQEITGQYPDGSQYTLNKPIYQLKELAYGELTKGIGISPRFAPVVYGAGLIDAIATEDLLAQEDINDTNNDGISAKYNRVPDIKSTKLEVGRFGHKAKHPTLAQQVAAAFRDDIGITNSFFASESCTKIQEQCHIASSIGGHKDVEIPDKLLDLVLTFNKWLAVPPTRNLGGEKEQKGRRLFYEADCHACHTPNYKTDKDYPDKYLANQNIYPYSDFALHDMGEQLADNVTEYQANGQEWKTPPLWGLGMQKHIRKNTAFLHDGRAQTIEEAILWHGGEAQNSKQAFMNMPKSDRAALLTFLEAI